MDNSIFEIASPISSEQAQKLHPMSLAFIGDAVQALYTRTRVTLAFNSKTGVLHKEVTKVVKAVSQSRAADAVTPLFDKIEADIFRRARNCHVQTSAKHAEMSEYRKASGLEAVIGYLYLTGDSDKLNKILEISCEENV